MLRRYGIMLLLAVTVFGRSEGAVAQGPAEALAPPNAGPMPADPQVWDELVVQGQVPPGQQPPQYTEMPVGEEYIPAEGEIVYEGDPGEYAGYLPWCGGKCAWRGVRLTVTPRFTFLQDDLSPRQLTFLNNNLDIQGPFEQSHYLLGGALQADAEITELVTFTAAADFAATTEDDSFGFGDDGVHTALSFLLNVDPMVENVYYGIGADIYIQPPLDITEVPGDLSPVVTGQIRGGAGVSTQFGNVFVRGGSRLAQDVEPFDRLQVPAVGGGFITRGRDVFFTTKHVEAGLETLLGPAVLTAAGGYRDDPETGYVFADLICPVPYDVNADIVSDFYMDKETNWTVSIGIAAHIGGIDRLHRKVLKPWTVGHMNRFQKYQFFQERVRQQVPF